MRARASRATAALHAQPAQVCPDDRREIAPLWRRGAVRTTTPVRSPPRQEALRAWLGRGRGRGLGRTGCARGFAAIFSDGFHGDRSVVTVANPRTLVKARIHIAVARDESHAGPRRLSDARSHASSGIAARIRLPEPGRSPGVPGPSDEAPTPIVSTIDGQPARARRERARAAEWWAIFETTNLPSPRDHRNLSDAPTHAHILRGQRARAAATAPGPRARRRPSTTTRFEQASDMAAPPRSRAALRASTHETNDW